MEIFTLLYKVSVQGFMLGLNFDILRNLEIFRNCHSSCFCGCFRSSGFVFPCIMRSKERSLGRNRLSTIRKQCGICLHIYLSLALSFQCTRVLLPVGLVIICCQLLSQQSIDASAPLPQKSGLFVQCELYDVIGFVKLPGPVSVSAKGGIPLGRELTRCVDLIPPLSRRGSGICNDSSVTPRPVASTRRRFITLLALSSVATCLVSVSVRKAVENAHISADFFAASRLQHTRHLPCLTAMHQEHDRHLPAKI